MTPSDPLELLYAWFRVLKPLKNKLSILKWCHTIIKGFLKKCYYFFLKINYKKCVFDLRTSIQFGNGYLISERVLD